MLESRQKESITRHFVWIGSLLVLAGLLTMWVRSYGTEDELRWMHGNVHRHVESAQGYVTVVVTTGGFPSDYWAWASSPNLSYGRDADWYVVGPPGESRWHIRVHYILPTFTLFLFVVAVSFRVVQRVGGNEKAPADHAGAFNFTTANRSAANAAGGAPDREQVRPSSAAHAVR